MSMSAIDEVLNLAIQKEQEAHDFYLDLAQKMEQFELKELLQQFASEELGHRAKLEQVKKLNILMIPLGKVMDLKIADYLSEVEPSPSMDFQQLLILAMQKEKAAFKLYSDLAKMTTNEQVKSIFLALAQEEAKHKLRFEIEYDELLLQEN